MIDNTGKKIDTYANIDLKQSGQKMKQLLTNAGYDVKMIQNYLHLSCPQPVYRWYHGQVLPTVDHLFMLSRLLGIHMEDFLVGKEDKKQSEMVSMGSHNRVWMLNAATVNDSMCDRIFLYCERVKEIM